MARLRIFAGPNGSGKSTLNEYLRGKFNYGCYINADDLKKEFDLGRKIRLSQYNLSLNQDSWKFFLNTKEADKRYLKSKSIYSIEFANNEILAKKKVDPYTVAVLADFLRESLIYQKETFSFETVLSHQSKVDFLKEANQQDYRCYLYFIATNSPDINLRRVEQRVLSNGHFVPKRKIIDRYERSLNNLLPALREVYRAYIFDNSGKEIKLIAELTPDKELNLNTNRIPEWFMKCVIEKLK